MNQKDKKYLIKIFAQASKISFSLVIYPVITLLIGIAIDKQLSTTPLFIIIAIIAGLALMTYSFKKINIKEIEY